MIFLCLCPIVFVENQLNSEAFSQNQILFMMYTTLLFLAAGLRNRWLAGFLLLTLAHRMIYRDLLNFEWYCVCLGGGLVTYKLVQEQYDGKGYRYALLFVMCLSLALAVTQKLEMRWLLYQLEPNGLFTLPSYLGMYTAVTAPVLFSLHPACLLLSLAGLFFSRSMFAVLAFAVSMLFYCFWAHRRAFRWLIIASPLLVAAGFGHVKRGVPSAETQRRFHIWQQDLNYIVQHSPFVGFGANSFMKNAFMEFAGPSGNRYYFRVTIKPENEEPLKKAIVDIAHKEGIDTHRLEEYHYHLPGGIFENLNQALDELRGRGLSGWVWGHPHNEYLKIWHEYGVPGLLLVGGFILGMFRRFQPKDAETVGLMGAFIAIIIVCFAHFPLYMARTASLMVFLTARLDRRLSDET